MITTVSGRKTVSLFYVSTSLYSAKSERKVYGSRPPPGCVRACILIFRRKPHGENVAAQKGEVLKGPSSFPINGVDAFTLAPCSAKRSCSFNPDKSAVGETTTNVRRRDTHAGSYFASCSPRRITETSWRHRHHRPTPYRGY